jgi:PAS domain S-box-containing protein
VKRTALRVILRLSGALAVVALAVFFRLKLQPVLGFEHHYAALLAAIVLAAALFGLWPALVTGILGGFAVDQVVRGHLLPMNRDELIGFFLFVGEGAVIAIVVEMQRRNHSRLRRSEERSSQLVTQYERELAERKEARAAERRHALWLEVILSSIADGLLVTDDHGIVTYLNSAGERITRIPAAEARGQNVDELFRVIDEEAGETLPSPVHEALGLVASGPRPEKTALVMPDGRSVPILVSAALMREDSGSVTGAVFLFHDMTRIREIEARRADSERRFAALADAVPALIWMSGEDGSWEYFNSAWSQWTGLSSEQMQGYGWMAGIHPDDLARCMSAYEASFEARMPFEIEHRLVGRNNEYRWVVNQGTPRYGPGDRFLGFIGSCVDVTEHKEAEEAFRQSEERFRRLNAELERFSAELARGNVELELQNRAIQRANEQKARFLATMSHELRTPMNAVIGFVDLLSEESAGPLTSKQKRFLGHVRTAGEHLLRLVENILDYSRIEAGRLQLNCQEFEARSVVQEVVAGISQIDRGKQLKVSIEIPTGFTVFADRQRFRQILYNLASNAVKFTPRGGQVTISAERDSSFTYVAVRDTGVGIAPDQLGPVFQEFHQARSPERNKGAGLGLAITQRLVQAHGGSISVESNVGEGSCFTFSLPTASPEHRDATREFQKHAS